MKRTISFLLSVVFLCTLFVSTPVSAETPATTEITSLTAGINSITVEWTEVNVSGYQIQYSTFSNFNNAKTVEAVNETSKELNKLSEKTTYYVRIRTYITENNKTYYSQWSKEKSVETKSFPAKTSVVSLNAKIDSIKVKWDEKEVNGYEIAYSTSSDFNNAKKIIVKKADTTSKAVNNLKKKTKYYFRIRTYISVNGTAYYSQWSKEKAAETKSGPAKTSIKELSARISSIKVEWTEKQVSGYEIAYSTSSDLKNAKKIKAKKAGTTKKTVNDLKKNTKYYFKKAVKTKSGPAKTAVKSLSAKESSIKVKWAEKRANGYEIAYSTSSNFKNAKKIKVKKAGTTKKTVKGLKKNTKYYFRIRTYITENGKTYYSKWSKKKAVKTKAAPKGKFEGCVKYSDAKKYVGKTVTVYGKVKSTYYAKSSNGSPTFINIGAPYGNSSRCTVVIWGKNRSKFNSPEKKYKNKTIKVTGKVKKYRGAAEIIVSSPSQIKIVK